jgi:hypothetical protein
MDNLQWYLNMEFAGIKFNKTQELSIAWEKMSDDDKKFWHYHNAVGFTEMTDVAQMLYHASMTLIFQGDYVRTHENLKLGCSILNNSDCCNLLEILGESKQSHEELKIKIQNFLPGHIDTISPEIIDILVPTFLVSVEMALNPNSNATTSTVDINAVPSFAIQNIQEDVLSMVSSQASDKFGEHLDAETQYKLGAKLLKGDGVKQDVDKAVFLHRQAAEQGHVKAQVSLAYSYHAGLGNQQDTEEAIVWYTKAAEENNTDAQFNLANIYYKGVGVEQDCKKAFEWFKKAAELGFEKAQHNLASLYNNGDCVDKDLKKSLYWFIKAAEQTNVEAQFIVGRKYFFGEGTKKSLKDCAYWINLARQNGHKDAEVVWKNEELSRYL